MTRSRYGRYHEGPDPLAPPVDLREALSALGDDVMEGTSPRQALRQLLRRGMKGQRGLDDLARRVNKRRQEILRRNNLNGTLEEVKKLLDSAVLEERKELARALDDDARFAEMQIAELSPSPAKAVQELAEYKWRSAKAKADYDKIRDLMGQELLDQRFEGIKKALENTTDEDRQQVSEMLNDLNDLLEAHGRGEDTQEQFDEFMDKHGEYFPDKPKNVEELLDSLAKRAAAAQRMRNSMTDEQRAELDALASQAFGNPSLMQQLSQLDQNLRNARPSEDWDSSERFRGEEGLGMGEGARAMAEIGELDQLGEQLAQSYAGASLDDIDLDKLVEHIGDDARVDVKTLAELERALQEGGFIERLPDGTWRLSPKSMRQLGEVALRDIAQRLSGRRGERDHPSSGGAAELTGSRRPGEFGDVQPWDVTRTVTNAVLRTGATNGAVKLSIDDVEVVEMEQHTEAAVALLADISFSMVMEGRWVPMKRTAMALNHLISTRFRGDHLELISFGRYAKTMSTAELTGLEALYEQGTNLHHALLLAERHIRKHPNAQPVILIVTDGEPTSHLLDDGEAFFDYPPHPLTIARTVQEFDAVAKLGAQVTIFRLGDDPGLGRFVDSIARRIGGRVVAPDLDGLGAAVVADYLRNRH